MIPRLEKLYGIFHEFVNEIATIAQYLPPLQSWIKVTKKQGEKNIADATTNDRVTFASVPTWYMDDVHQRLNVILTKSFQPLSDYVQELQLRFGSVINKTDEAIIDEMYEKFSLEEYVAKIEDYNQLIHIINGMVWYQPALIY